MSDLEFLLLALVGVAALVRLADLVAIPYPIVLVLAGLGVGFVDALPDVEVEAEVYFLVFLPPLLTAAGYSASPKDLKADLQALGFLSFVLVLATMGAVAVVAHAAISGLDWPAAFVLGAVVAPTDPVAAAATFGRLGVPDRVRGLVGAESMVNDATALVAYRVALTAAVSGSFSAGDAILEFVTSAAGGLALGLAFGWVEVRVLRRLTDTALAIFLTVTVPYAAYICAEELGVSGVLAVVAAAIYLGWFSHLAFSADIRLSAQAFWEVLEFALNALLFLLLGLQFPALVDDLREQLSLGDLLGGALLVSLTVVVVRLLAAQLPLLGDTARERLAIGWSGMRGAISLAAALAIEPEVAGRDQIIFVTFVVIFVTLVGQGLTLPLLLKVLKLSGATPWSPEEAIARLEAAQNALDRLDELEDEDAVDEEVLRRMRELYRVRFRRCQVVLGGDGDPGPHAARRETRLALRRDLIGVERRTLLELRAEGRLRPEVMRSIERDLDLEEARLPA